jgi:hypothetical protein
MSCCDVCVGEYLEGVRFLVNKPFDKENLIDSFAEFVL